MEQSQPDRLLSLQEARHKQQEGQLLATYGGAAPPEPAMEVLTRVLIIYTGGTIGMKRDARDGYVPAPNYLEQLLKTMSRFHDPLGIFGGKPIPEAALFNRLVRACEKGLDNPGDKNTIKPEKVTALVTPRSLWGKRTLYSIYEYGPLLDSSCMTMADWCRIATTIESNYELYDGFIVLHGTDTMAFTASALSFMLENLGKPVIFTGSQVPISEVRNDAIENLLGALTIAGHFIIPEVCIYFNSKAFRGNRTSKLDALSFTAFDSPNFPPLASAGIGIDVMWRDVWRSRTLTKFRVHKTLDPNVATLRLFPGITETTVRSFLQDPIRGVVLETYGAGNGPSNRPDILASLKEASDRGVVIVNCTQCKRGIVSDLYETGKALFNAGLVPGYDLTPECALAKLSYLLGKGLSPAAVRAAIRIPLRGELTVPQEQPQFCLTPRDFSALLHSVLDAQSEKESSSSLSILASPTRSQGDESLAAMLDNLGLHDSTHSDSNDLEEEASISGSDTPSSPALDAAHQELLESGMDALTMTDDGARMERALSPLLACMAASQGRLLSLSTIVKQVGPWVVDQGDSNGMTPLHHAALNGHVRVAVWLLSAAGASLHVHSHSGHVPLFYAASAGHLKMVKLLVKAGGHLKYACCAEAGALAHAACAQGNLSKVKAWVNAGIFTDADKRSLLHTAAGHLHLNIVEWLLDKGKSNGIATFSPSFRDRYGRTPLDEVQAYVNIKQPSISAEKQARFNRIIALLSQDS